MIEIVNVEKMAQNGWNIEYKWRGEKRTNFCMAIQGKMEAKKAWDLRVL